MKIRKLVFCVVVLSMLWFLHGSQSIRGEEIRDFTITEAGTYPIRISASDGSGTIVRYVTVLFPRTVVSVEHFEAIDAYDVSVEEGTLEKLTDEEMIKITSARAWDTRNGAEIPITAVSCTLIDKAAKLYRVSFATQRGTSIDVSVIEVKAQVMSDGVFFTENYTNFVLVSADYVLYLLILLMSIIPVLILLGMYMHTRYRLRKVGLLLDSEV